MGTKRDEYSKCHCLKRAVLCLTWMAALIIWLICFAQSSSVQDSEFNSGNEISDPFIKTRSMMRKEGDNGVFGTTGIICGALILVFMYVLIMFEIVHRTIAATLASTLGVAVMGALGDRPSMDKITSYIDSETLLLLFSMMLLVALMVPTGMFDYSAVFAFKLTHGRTWPLIGYLTLFTAVLSAFLDNVTTILLMGPVVIRICVVADLPPQPVMLMVIFSSNLGGMATPIGDPPNIMIINQQYFSDHVRIWSIYSNSRIYLKLYL